MSLFLCPICRRSLMREETRYRCENGHSYDIASAGYVHLLPANQKHSLVPGDDKQMAAARNRFLNGAWYQPLREAIARIALEVMPSQGTFFDSGCGEGYYTTGVRAALEGADKAPAVYGIDISKYSLRWAAKRDKSIEFAVASAYHLPIPDNSVDVLLNCFSPLAVDEFRRVIRPGGCFLYVVPAPRHLWELKQVLYDVPYENKEQRIPYKGFEYIRVDRVENRILLPDNQTIQDLFGMTPYLWKTPKQGIERLRQLERLEVQIAFDLHLFRRI